jgi:molybdate transport system substrate-binding protein
LRRTALILAVTFAQPAHAEEVVVFAAASLKTALDAVAADFQAQTGHRVVISYAGSNQLAKQILEGAPADIFLSAAVNWMDAVEKAGLVAHDQRADLLGNSLVLIAHDPAAMAVTLSPRLDLAAMLGDNRLAMGMVDSVPAGQYGKAALENLGLWTSVEAKVAQSDNVRAALILVSTGEAPYGIVYATDAAADPGVKVIATFPEGSHFPIRYPAALLTAATDAADLAFYRALSAAPADAIFAAQGFQILP